MDWLHCNLCFLQPGDGVKFSLTSCGHIYCVNCVEAGVNETCRMCTAKCTTIPLTGKLKPDVELFFTDPMDLLRRYQKQVAQVYDFQKNHRKRLISHVRDKLQKQEDLVRKAEQFSSCRQGLEREIIKLREENSYLKRLISEKGIGLSHSRPSTPVRFTSSPIHRGEPTRSSSLHFQASPCKSPMTYVNRITSALQSQFGSQKNDPPQCEHCRCRLTVRHILVDCPHLQPMTGSTPPCSIAPGRVSVRTPPCGGRIGTVRGTPVQMDTQYTPKSVPLPSPTRYEFR